MPGQVRSPLDIWSQIAYLGVWPSTKIKQHPVKGLSPLNYTRRYKDEATLQLFPTLCCLLYLSTYLFNFAVLGMEPRASCMLGRSYHGATLLALLCVVIVFCPPLPVLFK